MQLQTILSSDILTCTIYCQVLLISYLPNLIGLFGSFLGVNNCR